MITAIYDLRQHGFKHIETGSDHVKYMKEIKGITWEITEWNDSYMITRNSVIKKLCDNLEELYNYLNDNKLI